MGWTVLLEAPFDPIRRQMNSVLLTIDLTKAVADEAIERKDCVVVSYRMLDQGYAYQKKHLTCKKIPSYSRVSRLLLWQTPNNNPCYGSHSRV